MKCPPPHLVADTLNMMDLVVMRIALLVLSENLDLVEMRQPHIHTNPLSEVLHRV